MAVTSQMDDQRGGLPVTVASAGLPAVEAGRGQFLVSATKPADRRGRRLAIPALLLAGWGGLFAYCAAYLREDLPFRPAALAEAGRAGEDAPRKPFVLPDMNDVPARAAEAPAAPEPPAVSLAGVPSAPAAAMPKPIPAPGSADYVGTWGPTPAACGRPSRRRGYLPATITADRARAGRTLCTFRDGHRSGNAWVMAADCSDRGRRWSSQVRLLVEGDHLTWSSNRGTASYVRCSRRAG